MSFALFSIPVMLLQAFWRPDVVRVCVPGFACTPAALLAAKLANPPVWLHVQDYEVDVAFDMGLLRGNSARKLVTGLEPLAAAQLRIMSTIFPEHAATGGGKGRTKIRPAENFEDSAESS